MAANKFATMLHRNTNKITLILIYAVLEWTLIILLLLNSLFSYLIIKFSQYFGLKPPCLWCSRIDHFFEPQKNLHRHHLCEAHSTEISKLGYCSNHQKLALHQDMCEDCSSSRPDFGEVSKNFASFPWVKQIGMIQGDGEQTLKSCSCCGVSLENKIYSPYIVINPSWDDVLEYTQKGNLIAKSGNEDHMEEGNNSDENISDFVDRGGLLCFGSREEEAEEDTSVSVSISGLKELGGNEDDKVGVCLEDKKEDIKDENSSMTMEDPNFDASFEILPQHLEFFVDCSGHRLVPIELIDSTTEEDQIRNMVGEDQEKNDHQEAKLGSEAQIESVVEVLSVHDNTHVLKFPVFGSTEKEETGNSLVLHGKEFDSVHEQVVLTRATQTPSMDIDDAQEIATAEGEKSDSDFPPGKKVPNFPVFGSTEKEDAENSLVFHGKEFDSLHEQVVMIQATQIPSMDIDDAQEIAEGEESDTDLIPVSEEVSHTPINETEAEVSIGTEIPDLGSTDDIQPHDTLSSYAFTHDDPSTDSANLHGNNNHDSMKDEEEEVELKTLPVEVSEQVINNQLSLSSEVNEIEEEKILDTPISMESFHQLHKKLLLLERKESGTEESLDGSIISDFEAGDGVFSVERLTSALRAERKTLHVLYTELEEERSASAVAANQTMAMINRLQEEKAAMQMEALQYQRMMEEQSEYDQEALQLLNELMVKREKEKQELEKELEMYRKKVLDYEAKEKTRMLRRSVNSSVSCSNSEDNDGSSVDLNQEAKEENGYYSHEESGNHNTPVDTVLNLEESLVDFEEERLSILEQLKVLEEKLFTLSDEEEKHFEDIRPIEDLYKENGKHLDEGSDFEGEEINGVVTNGFSKEMSAKIHQERRIIGSNGKRLLPLFDAISAENGDGEYNGNGNGFHPNKLENSAVTRFELEEKRVGIEEEVDQLYGRLQALEADREFLKHCITSLKKGDKGMDLLQEILQHLRDLKNVELRVRNSGDGALV